MSYEALLEGGEPLRVFSICTVCLNVERGTRVAERRFRCGDCGSPASADTQQSVEAYLEANPTDTLERNLQLWSAAKGIRPAYKMLRSARYKCLLTLARRRNQ